jgi:hypothetical protein
VQGAEDDRRARKVSGQGEKDFLDALGMSGDGPGGPPLSGI